MKKLFAIIIFIIFFWVGWFLADYVRYLKQSNPQEIKVGSIVVLGEGGSMRYCNPEDVYSLYVESGFIIHGGSLQVLQDRYFTIKAEVSGINTKDINPAPPMQSIKIIKRIVSGDSVRYYVPNDFK